MQEKQSETEKQLLKEIYMLQKTVEEKNKMIDNLFNAVSDGMCVISKDYIIMKANFAFAESLNLDLSQLVGKKCYEVIHKTDEPWPECPFRLTKQDVLSHSQEINDPNLNVSLLVKVSPIFDENEELSGMVHIIRDISKEKEREERFRRLQEFFTKYLKKA